MNYWLLKTEPETFSIEDLRRKKKEPWNGVRNFQARNNLKLMKKGDLCFIYHTGREKAVVGTAKVVSDPYPDPTQFDKSSHYYDATSRKESPKWILVDVSFVKLFKHPVTLEQIKTEQNLSAMVLTKAPRLSVQPVSERQFRYIEELAK